jgi:DNA-directed RNA polymerase specialized sigma24 family protein
MSEGLSYREIAPLLGKTEGALRVQLYRCIERARRVSEGIGRRAGPDGGGRGTP